MERSPHLLQGLAVLARAVSALRSTVIEWTWLLLDSFLGPSLPVPYLTLESP